MKPAGGYYLLYLTRTDRLTRDRPTGYLFNHFYFLSCVCVSGVSVWHARREKQKKWQQEQTRQKGMPDFYFYSSLSFLSLLFCSEFQKKKIMKIKNKKKYGKCIFFFFCFFLCMFYRSVRQLVAVGAVIKYTHAQAREKHTKTDSLIMLSAARERVLPYIHTRQQTCWVFFFFLSLLSLFFFLRFFLCVVFRFR